MGITEGTPEDQYKYQRIPNAWNSMENPVSSGRRNDTQWPTSPSPEGEDSGLEFEYQRIPSSFRDQDVMNRNVLLNGDIDTDEIGIRKKFFLDSSPSPDQGEDGIGPPKNSSLQSNPSIHYSNKLMRNLPNYPKEKRKTLLAFALVALSLVINSISIALTHDRVPDRPPLPDAILDSIHIIPELMKVPDVLVIITISLCTLTILFHRCRWIISRRVFFILSLLYFMRSITMYLTVLPIANYTVYCAPKSNTTSAVVILSRIGELLGGGGMQISGHKTACGDYIYSGHTALLMTGYLILKEYSSRRFVILHWISWLMSWSGMIILLIARGHYTIDVVIGYYAATRMFWTYHSLCINEELKVHSETNYYSNTWWFPVFQYLEGNVTAGKLPQHYSPPWRNYSRNRNSLFR